MMAEDSRLFYAFTNLESSLKEEFLENKGSAISVNVSKVLERFGIRYTGPSDTDSFGGVTSPNCFTVVSKVSHPII